MVEPIPKVAILLLNRNQEEMTINCLKSLNMISYPHYEIILVDNGSEDDSLQEVNNAFPAIKIIANGLNMGVAGGRNIGINYALRRDANYVLLLDNDTIVHRDFISEMVAVGEKNQSIGILTGKIYFYSQPNKIWSAGGSLKLSRCRFDLIGYNEIDQGQYDKISEVDHVAGCCLMIKREVIGNIGLLDERFNPYFCEDTDWCLRARKKGYKVIYTPKSVLWHHIVKKTTVSDNYWYLKGRNLLIFMFKHASIQDWLIFSVFFMTDSLKVLYRETKAGNFRLFVTMAKGSLASFRIKKGIDEK